MEMINKILHLLLFAAMLLMYYRMFTTVSRRDMKKLKTMSWVLLRVAMVFTLTLNFLSCAQDFVREGFTPVWMHAASFTGSVICFLWAETIHGWKLWHEFLKEIHPHEPGTGR